MDMLSDFFQFMAGGPALVGLVLMAPVIFLAADWRLSLSALLIQYLLADVALSRTLRAEVVIAKVVVGVLVVPILYLVARRIQDMRNVETSVKKEGRFWSLQSGWFGGPLGLPLRLLAFLLAGLAVVRLFQNYRPALVPGEIALVASWLAAMGLLGLVLSGDPLRVAAAALTVLTGFDLVYASLEQNLAIVGLFGAFTLLAALAFSYLAAVQGLNPRPVEKKDEEAEL